MARKIITGAHFSGVNNSALICSKGEKTGGDTLDFVISCCCCCCCLIREQVSGRTEGLLHPHSLTKTSIFKSIGLTPDLSRWYSLSSPCEICKDVQHSSGKREKKHCCQSNIPRPCSKITIQMHQSHFNLFNYALDELLMEKGLFLNLSKSEAFFFISRKKKKKTGEFSMSLFLKGLLCSTKLRFRENGGMKGS